MSVKITGDRMVSWRKDWRFTNTEHGGRATVVAAQAAHKELSIEVVTHPLEGERPMPPGADRPRRRMVRDPLIAGVIDMDPEVTDESSLV